MQVESLEVSWEEWDAVVAQIDEERPTAQVRRSERRNTISFELGEARSILAALEPGNGHRRDEALALLERKIEAYVKASIQH